MNAIVYDVFGVKECSSLIDKDHVFIPRRST